MPGGDSINGEISLTTRAIRRAFVDLGVVGVALFFLASPVHGAATNESFAPSKVPVVFMATGPDGRQFSFRVEVTQSDLLPESAEPSILPALPRGETYFCVGIQTVDPPSGVPFVPLSMPDTDASLLTSYGTSQAAGINDSYSLDAQWYFPVRDSITWATLKIRPASVVSIDSNGTTFTNYKVDSETIDFVTSAPVTPPTAPVGVGTPPFTSTPFLSTSEKSGASAWGRVGAGVGGLALLGTASAALVELRRRRAFYRADREGRVVLVGPPLLAMEPTAAREGEADEGVPEQARGAIVVKLLGWLEITGARRPAIAGPVQEIIVFLVLNPGRTFTSIQLRESIWCLGRTPLSSGTLRKYMVELRRGFGPGVVVPEKYRYQLTAAVTSDLAVFRAAAAGHDLSGAEQALELVRGPVLHGCFDGKKNAPFAWAVGIANDIEDEVTTVAYDLVLACLTADVPDRATHAIAKGLRCAETNMRLRILDLRVGAALGGSREVGRRLVAGSAAVATFASDVARLEQEARQLGWQAFSP